MSITILNARGEWELSADELELLAKMSWFMATGSNTNSFFWRLTLFIMTNIVLNN
jgi:hypothetical protein